MAKNVENVFVLTNANWVKISSWELDDSDSNRE